MHKFVLLAAAGAMLLFGEGKALSQGAILELTPEQERTIYGTAVAAPLPRAPPGDFRLALGADVPLAIDLQEIPAAIEVPAVRGLRYLVVNRQVVLVDPRSRKVVKIIRQQ
jgi:hypothetical protein